jgi:hypothetical protein
MATSKNIWVDSADKPNGPNVPMPENGSIRFNRSKNLQPRDWIPVILLFSIPGLVGICILSVYLGAVWRWAEYNAMFGTGIDWALATTIRSTVVLFPPAVMVCGLSIAVMRGWWWVQNSRILRMQNDHPVDVSTLIRAEPRLLEASLKNYYLNEGKWADASTWRNMNGSWSPTFQAPGQLGMADMPLPDDDEGDGALTLPPNIDLGDLPIPPNHIGYGIGPMGEVISAPVGSAYHALRQGDTGSGKTTNLNAELCQVHKIMSKLPNQFELFAGDFKGEFAATWSQSPAFEGGIATLPSEIADMLEIQMQEITSRYAKFVDIAESSKTLVRNVAEYAKVTGERLPWRLVYLDEINALLGGTIPKPVRDRVDAALKRGLQLGRGAGVFYECGAQYMTKDLFDREGSKQFVTRAYFGGWDVTAMNMVFMGKVDREWADKYRNLVTGIPGRGVYAGLGGAVVPFQGLNASVEDILGSIALLTGLSPLSPQTHDSGISGSLSQARMPSETPETLSSALGSSSFAPGISGESPVKLSEVIAAIRGNPAMNTYFTEQILSRRKLKQGKKEIIFALWSAKPGNNDGWTATSAFYDQVVGGA